MNAGSTISRAPKGAFFWCLLSTASALAFPHLISLSYESTSLFSIISTFLTVTLLHSWNSWTNEELDICFPGRWSSYLARWWQWKHGRTGLHLGKRRTLIWRSRLGVGVLFLVSFCVTVGSLGCVLVRYYSLVCAYYDPCLQLPALAWFLQPNVAGYRSFWSCSFAGVGTLHFLVFPYWVSTYWLLNYILLAWQYQYNSCHLKLMPWREACK